jgi:5-enolpyruvylshikimate-3-phosphate synthase
MNEYRVRRGRAIAGEITVPGDLLISRLAITIAALANGPSVLTGVLPAAEIYSLLIALPAHGVRCEFLSPVDPAELWQPDQSDPDARPTVVRIHGVHMNTAARDIIHLLPPGPDREALLCLLTPGKRIIAMPGGHPDHLTRLLSHYQVKTARTAGQLTLWGSQMPESRDLSIPGDTTLAAHWITAASMQPGSDLTVRGCSLNTSRTAFLRVLVNMGAQITEDFQPSSGTEPSGSVIVRGGPLRGVTIDATLAAALTRELPVLAVAAGFAKGPTLIRVHEAGIPSLRTLSQHLKLMGVAASDLRDGLEITGSALQPLQPGVIPSRGDPFLAMAFAVAGLFTGGETIIEDTACVEETWPGFGRELRHFQSRAISEGVHTPVINTWKMPVPARSKDLPPNH